MNKEKQIKNLRLYEKYMKDGNSIKAELEQLLIIIEEKENEKT